MEESDNNLSASDSLTKKYFWSPNSNTIWISPPSAIISSARRLESSDLTTNRRSSGLGKSGVGSGSNLSVTSTTSGSNVSGGILSWELPLLDSGVSMIIVSPNSLPMIGVSSSPPPLCAQLDKRAKETIKEHLFICIILKNQNWYCLDLKQYIVNLSFPAETLYF
jgi:hypothetical protein